MKRNPVPSLVLDPVRESLISSSGALLLQGGDPGRGPGPWPVARRWRRGGRRGRSTTRARCCSMSRPRSRSAVTAWPTSPRSAPSRRCSGRSPPIRRCRGCSRPWPPMSTPRSPRSGRRAQARAAVWARRRPLAGTPGTRAGGQVIVDLDATLVTAHSDKEGAEPTYKRGFGFAPMCAFVDHGEHGTGETLAVDLRPGKASPWNSADHITVLDAALAQLPERERGQVLVRADTGGCSKAFLHHITDARVGVLDRVPRPRDRQGRDRGDPRAGLAGRGRRRRRTPRRRPGRRAHRLDAGPGPSYRPRPGRRTGRPGCGSSPAANAPTPAPSCG